MKFRTGMEVVREHAAAVDEPVPEDSLSGSFFQKIGLPMVVACTGCEMTMTAVSSSVRVDEEGFVWCIYCLPGV